MNITTAIARWAITITATSTGQNPAFVTETAYYQALGAFQNLINQNPSYGASIASSNYTDSAS